MARRGRERGRGGAGEERGREERPREPREGKPREGKPREGKLRDGRAARKRPGFPDQLEGRNLVLASLETSLRIRHIWIDSRAKPDSKIDAIRSAAKRAGVVVTSVLRADLDHVAQAHVHNGVIGFAEPLPAPSLKEVLDAVARDGRDPFLLLLNEVQYEQNLGAILRSAAYSGVDCVITPTRRGATVSPTVQRVAMGGAEEVPVVRQGLMAALATLRRAGVRVIGAESDGESLYSEVDFSGPLALVMGGEDRGLGPKVRERCDEVVRIPRPRSGIVSSLNVSVAAGLLLFERVRSTIG
jgi:23S rRNA (guanosine2251-2'-O)-methyltransferase